MSEISIIVPVYNAERFLQECIDSLLHQTKDDIEIVLVNDGSTDNSKKIIKENCERHDNITFVDQENKGVCIARNAGIEAAKGEYIGWLDADDFLKPTALEELYDLMKQNNADYVVQNRRADNRRADARLQFSQLFKRGNGNADRRRRKYRAVKQVGKNL